MYYDDLHPIAIELENARNIIHSINLTLNDHSAPPDDDVHLFGYKSISYERLIDMVDEADKPETHFDHDTVEYDAEHQLVMVSLMDAINLSNMLHECHLFMGNKAFDFKNGVGAVDALNTEIRKKLNEPDGFKIYKEVTELFNEFCADCRKQDEELKHKEE